MNSPETAGPRRARACNPQFVEPSTTANMAGGNPLNNRCLAKCLVNNLRFVFRRVRGSGENRCRGIPTLSTR